ncbi:MAG: nucleotidyltransferase family protein [Clostridia bacterium]|nr:nucleotidyltransferase family protein [Clostridia bacterium]
MSILAKLDSKREEIMKIASKYGVQNIRVFGSIARGEETVNSDLDILVKFEQGRSLFDLIDLKYDLEDLLEREVDVITENSIHWYLKDGIEAEAVEL